MLEKLRSKLSGDNLESKIVSSNAERHREGVIESISLPSSPPQGFSAGFHDTYSSLAVRGAIYARPEGYCQCWDQHETTWTTKKCMRKAELERMVM